ncbi:DUF2059 domain-containing protein [Bradyrhizobium japonicum]|jgi:hypothetical protein|uniref:DUF2059 domain-containing protein n=1 Tax=Bradyrhizobium japonicum TaxID=375 RepID=UPI00209E5FBE|nr:DUF2059 domain-containing protein [Bradyrhizobium japonicum]MCP1767098.1 hypothetical protein [Bradyrhizobium japonicum]MCP1789237.1 hypothetical protein [Bradyrhizobium japonicum]MCP1801736.1 hypothetical protein [Bradyrhizobium japonicum]MCP1820045.1 hypothetical protein [Bradyrhizobium japonicum]MCP1868445.1 hypothetical protein [Bradyrhizobium japonicum]
MKSVLKFLPAATLAVGLAVSAVPAIAQQPAPAQKAAPAPAQPKATPAAIAAAKEILQMKNANAMYAGAVPGMVEKTKITLIQQNLNYQKDLNEVAQVVVQQLNGRQNEIGEGMAQVYASEFTEQELKDLVTFYKSPLGQKLIDAEPRAIGLSMAFMNSWAQNFSETVMGAFRAEMRKRGKEI